MVEAPRKKSPRAPSMALDEALERALRAYEKDRLHPAPTEVLAQNLGYKGANNGSALSAIASLRYFGLLERPSEGLLAISKDVETYKFSPDPAQKQAVLVSFLTKPTLYTDLLEKFQNGLPSDANLRFDLIQRGFSPQAADLALASFKRSVEFAGYFSGPHPPSMVIKPDAEIKETASPPSTASSAEPTARQALQPTLRPEIDDATDSIPVRLPGGRRAWLLIPTPFFEGDKVRLKAQIDLLLTEDEDGEDL